MSRFKTTTHAGTPCGSRKKLISRASEAIWGLDLSWQGFLQQLNLLLDCLSLSAAPSLDLERVSEEKCHSCGIST